MNKAQLIDHLAAGADLSKAKADAILTLMTDVITKTLAKGDEVVLHGIGKLSVKSRAARVGRNPATGAQLKIPARKVPAFSAAKQLKDAVNISAKKK